VFDRYPDQLKGKLNRVDAGIEVAVTDYGWLVREEGGLRKG